MDKYVFMICHLLCGKVIKSLFYHTSPIDSSSHLSDLMGIVDNLCRRHRPKVRGGRYTTVRSRVFRTVWGNKRRDGVNLNQSEDRNFLL